MKPANTNKHIQIITWSQLHHPSLEND